MRWSLFERKWKRCMNSSNMLSILSRCNLRSGNRFIVTPTSTRHQQLSLIPFLSVATTTTDESRFYNNYYLTVAGTVLATVSGFYYMNTDSTTFTTTKITGTTSSSHRIIATSPLLTMDVKNEIGHGGNVTLTSPAAATATKGYDFIVVGYGTAGRSAVTTLQRQCPNAKIAVMDPFLHHQPSSSLQQQQRQRNGTFTQHQPIINDKNIDYYNASRVTEFDPLNKECVVMIESTNSTIVDTPEKAVDSNNTQHLLLSYRHAILIATGCRGAPIPCYLIDEKAQSRTLEYRPTLGVPHATANIQQQRPITSQGNIRKLIKRQANSGASIAVLGSGWDAIDLIACAAMASSKRKYVDPTTTASNNEPNMLIYGSYGPVSHIVPNYLSVEITKRLQSKRITIVDRSLIRYISYIGDRSKPATAPSSQQQSQLQVYTAKSYDFLDGKAVQADYVIVAPDVYGARGTAAFATSHIPSFLQDNTHSHTAWYHTWSSLTMIDDDDDGEEDPTTLLSCYRDDGRIVVNTELYACHGVFAAGSVAKYPNGRNGNAMVAGCGVVDGSNAGYIAARNMAQLYDRYNQMSSTNDSFLPFGRSNQENKTSPDQFLVKDPIPVWRSDIRTVSTSDTDQQLSSLEDIGIIALCVGNCDTEGLATHGVWWTNHAAHRRLLALAEMNGDDARTEKQRRKMKQSFKPVYGFGVVFYLDRSNKIQGVMTWGLPFYRSDNGRQLNEQFLEQIKHAIKTNGEFRTIESEQDRIEFTNYLDKVSKELVGSAFSKHGSGIGMNHRLDGKLERLPRALHRFTEIRPPNARMGGLLKQNGGQNLGILGQDLFVRFEQDDTPDNPIPLPLAENLGSAIARVKAQYDWDVWEQVERRWDANENRARPSKEDPLWIRKGDEGRATSSRDVLSSAYKKALHGQ